MQCSSMIYSESGPHLFLEQSATRQITEWKYNQDKKHKQEPRPKFLNF